MFLGFIYSLEKDISECCSILFALLGNLLGALKCPEQLSLAPALTHLTDLSVFVYSPYRHIDLHVKRPYDSCWRNGHL